MKVLSLKSEKHSFVIPSLCSGQRLVSRSPEYNERDSEESDITEILRCGVYPEPQILRRFAPQNDMGEGLLRMTLRRLFTRLSNLELFHHRDHRTLFVFYRKFLRSLRPQR